MSHHRKTPAAPMLRGLFILALLAISSTIIVAHDTTTYELWGELYVWFQNGPKTRYFLRAEDTSNRDIGGGVDYVLNKQFSTRFGYGYYRERTGPTPFPENRWYIDLFYKTPLGNDWTFSDRNREEFRWQRDAFSTRYRNRLRFQHPWQVGNKTVTPYGSVEFFYQPTFRAWTREEYRLGVETPVSKTLMLDPYLALQHDQHGEFFYIYAVGIGVNLYF